MQNNWYVLTGAPSSGKTTVLQLLEKKGYHISYEWARIYIDRELKKGKTITEIRKDEFAFQKKILELKISFEKKLSKKRMLFMERGIPDSIAYMEMLGMKDETLFKKILKNCIYKKVFLMELLEYKVDYARTESQEQAYLLEELLQKSYEDLKIQVIKVPRMSAEERMNFILQNI